jgi:hypothetical protein
VREEHRLRVSEERALGRIFVPKKDEVTREGRNDLYSSPNIFRVIKSRRMRWAGHVACMDERRSVHRTVMGKSEGK